MIWGLRLSMQIEQNRMAIKHFNNSNQWELETVSGEHKSIAIIDSEGERSTKNTRFWRRQRSFWRRRKDCLRRIMPKHSQFPKNVLIKSKRLQEPWSRARCYKHMMLKIKGDWRNPIQSKKSNFDHEGSLSCNNMSSVLKIQN